MILRLIHLLSVLNFSKSYIMEYMNIQYGISMNITIYSKLSSRLHNSSSSVEVSYKNRYNGNFSINKVLCNSAKKFSQKSFFSKSTTEFVLNLSLILEQISAWRPHKESAPSSKWLFTRIAAIWLFLVCAYKHNCHLHIPCLFLCMVYSSLVVCIRI